MSGKAANGLARVPLWIRCAVICAVSASAVRSEPYLAVRYGYKCSQCHTNPTGGGKRNKFGNIFTQTEMPSYTLSGDALRGLLGRGGTEAGDEDGSGEGAAAGDEASGSPYADLVPASTFWSGTIGDFFSLGGDFRFNNRTVFRNNEGSSSNTFDITQGSLYASVDLFGEALTLYLDETVAPGGASAREVFGLARGPGDTYLKAGRILPPYGLRLEDDTAFIRELTGFNFGVQDLGAELGWEPGPISLQLAATNGSQGTTDDNRDKQYTGMVSYVDRYWRIGGHGSWNNAALAKRLAVGGYAGLNLGFIDIFGFNLGRFTLLGEVDHLIDELEEVAGSPKTRQLIAYGAVNYQLFRGVNLVAAYDYADPDLTVSEDSFIRVSGGVEYTVMQFVQLRSFFRFRDDIETSTRDDEGVVDFEIHLFF